MNFNNLFNMQGMLFAVMLLGLFLRKKGIITNEGKALLTDLVIDVTLPASILKAFQIEFSMDILKSCIVIFILAIVIQIFSWAVGFILYPGFDPKHKKVLQYATICSNAGILGNPIAEGIYGTEGLVLASVYLIPQRIMMWSSGLAVFSGTSDKMKTLKKVVTHPCILACVLGIILMVTGLPLPPGLDGAVTAVGNCNTAMSMMVIGMILADIDLKDFWDWTVVKYTVHRLVVIPAVVYIVCSFLPLNKTVLGLCVLLAAMPAGATTSILAEKYQVDSPFATKMVIFSTLLSLPTICLWSIFLQ